MNDKCNIPTDPGVEFAEHPLELQRLASAQFEKTWRRSADLDDEQDLVWLNGRIEGIVLERKQGTKSSGS
jgi:hypothetical protein